MITKAIILVLAAGLSLAACTTVDQTRLPDGRSVYKIACGAAAPWEICRDQAADVCPAGYETLEMNSGFNRKEMTILCPGGEPAHLEPAPAPAA